MFGQQDKKEQGGQYKKGYCLYNSYTHSNIFVFERVNTIAPRRGGVKCGLTVIFQQTQNVSIIVLQHAILNRLALNGNTGVCMLLGLRIHILSALWLSAGETL